MLAQRPFILDLHHILGDGHRRCTDRQWFNLAHLTGKLRVGQRGISIS